MKSLKWLFIVSLFLVLSCSNVDYDPQAREWPESWLDEDISAKDFVKSMKIGWNLGNTLDAHNNLTPSETIWGNPEATQRLMHAVKNHGFDAVRIPVTWGSMVGRAPNYTINIRYLYRVAEVVNYAANAGLISIINMHHDGANGQYWLSVRTENITGKNKERIDAQFTSMWIQIANYFRNAGNYVVFQGFNELHDGSWGNGSPAQRARVNELNQLFTDAVRSAGGNNENRFLVVSPWVTRPSLLNDLVLPDDTAEDRLIVNFHFYDPYWFAIVARTDTWDTPQERNHIRNTFRNARNWWPDVPIIIGEYGAVRQATATGRIQRKSYMEYVTGLAKEFDFVPFFWDNGATGTGEESFGIINRNPPHAPTNNEAAEIIQIMMNAIK